MLRRTVKVFAPLSLMSSVAWRSFSSSTVPHYDLVVIGGGSGGLACSKQAADLGKKVAVLDFVSPSPQGTTWGLGGTCVNVGCIPKKLMHQVALVGDTIKESKHAGWTTNGAATFSWEDMGQQVRNYVKSLNWGHKIQLIDKEVTYLNAQGSFLDPHTIKTVDKKGQEGKISADYVVIAVGGRPRYPDIPGAKELGITSDDIFWMKKPPGKTLVIGGSYVALECAGFLTGMNYDTTVMVRSICLRSFDQQMAGLVTDHMEHHGTKFLWQCSPISLQKTSDGKIKVIWSREKGQEGSDVYDTVMFAIGRDPVTSDMKLENAGVDTNSKSGHVIGCHEGESERTSVPHIFAIGDVLQDGIELTPVAIRAGRLLAERIFNKSKVQMNYNKIPTTVFTPLEYACVGMSEDQAATKHGPANIEVYHAFYKPLELTLTSQEPKHFYIKLICDKKNDEKILGFHISGPNAGEIMQGFAVAFNMGMTRSQLCSTVGIHPTCAEEVVKLNITKSSGLDPNVTGC